MPGVSGERVFDVLLGVSVLSWAALGLWHAEPADRWTAVRVTIACLHVGVGLLILFRARAVAQGSFGAMAAALPALLISGWALRSAASPGAWAIGPGVAFVIGGAWAMWSLAALGRCFAILPSLRGVVVRGPYRVMRHPAYVGELVMIAACAWSAWSTLAWWAILPPIAAVAFVALRIVAEERVLAADDRYTAYASRVRWRLIPGVW